MAKATEAQLRANAKYDASNTKMFCLKLNLNTDQKIIARLDEVARLDPVRGKQGYIKELILRDIGE